MIQLKWKGVGYRLFNNGKLVTDYFLHLIFGKRMNRKYG